MEESVMENIDVVLSGSITSFGVKVVGLCLSIPCSKLENPTSTNHRQLFGFFIGHVPPHDSYGAAVVLPFRQGKVHHHEQSNLRLRRQGVDSFGSSHHLGAQFGSQGQGVVRHGDGAEGGGGVVLGKWLDDLYGCGVGAAYDVVPVESEVA